MHAMAPTTLRPATAGGATLSEARFAPWAFLLGLTLALLSLAWSESRAVFPAPAGNPWVSSWERALCPPSWLWTVRLDLHASSMPAILAGLLGNAVLWDWAAACVRWSVRGRRPAALALLALALAVWFAAALRGGF